MTLGILGVWGVNCFFVLTGFLLGRPFIAVLLDDVRRFPSVQAFYIRRFLRIYPMYLLAIVATGSALSLFGGRRPGLTDFISHVFLVHGFFTSCVFSIDAPLWTMGIDAEFYLLLPIAALVMRPALRGRSKAFRVLAVVSSLTLVIIGSVGYRFVQAAGHPTVLHDYAASIVYVRNLFGMATAFAIGILIAISKQVKLNPPRYVTIAIGFAGLALAFIELLLRLEVNLESTIVGFIKMAAIDPLGAISSGMILFALVNARSKTLRAFTESKIIQQIVTLSYGIYLFHMPIISAIRVAFFAGHDGTLVLFELAMVSLPVVGLIAFLANRFVERPFLELKNRFEG